MFKLFSNRKTRPKTVRNGRWQYLPVPTKAWRKQMEETKEKRRALFQANRGQGTSTINAPEPSLTSDSPSQDDGPGNGKTLAW